MDGNFIEEFSIPNGGSIRDMTYDGEYFYGVANGSTIYQMDFESKTLVDIVEARAQQATAAKVNPESMTQEQLSGFENAQQLLENAVNDVIVSVEKYPNLKAVESYQTFLAQYEGSENRILVERKRYNEMVQDYNKSIRSFPGNLIAGWFGFEPKPYFKG